MKLVPPISQSTPRLHGLHHGPPEQLPRWCLISRLPSGTHPGEREGLPTDESIHGIVDRLLSTLVRYDMVIHVISRQSYCDIFVNNVDTLRESMSGWGSVVLHPVAGSILSDVFE